MFLLRITEALKKKKIDYALVGGYALSLHGAVRGTIDVDIVIRSSKKDYVALEKALLAFGLAPKLPVDAQQIFDFREEYIKNKNLVAWSFYNPKNPIELLDIIITHDLQKMKTEKIHFQNHEVKVASISELISMKKKSGRTQDKEDIKALESIRRKK
ncbi:MAG: hypothetical protein COV43_00075 [Deltaproteobacteria bacterium CG11_big_fil_rev_8_21_14_0_20_42_23]|nr:MAG: hypothetical protein COV43_00075 [Deltaproteobacteria bacterium CG11_big_fil_rev_8_21_14_0_20_42_23]PJC64253.1 MAG: hypothetical protein CO021_04415 [Deltaproteobacteria bacterium CG_4_9_14_0_2_um_filter_42_21]